ncbi:MULTISPECIES: helicase-exonuclease AddAB subunit AddB [Bacillaceae]|uniref:ATP-dependent helicase/deoxyribonuclease subunit B n=1 Tax=Evansella alkalicola TaxID=745819 RepID=A0ABS6JMZ3_9BACI|nr:MULTISPECIES: helicase-exonuclease AddAB subunit AddB [Bacillaceae]MBU9719930.1 helicase-exonuclease AddAB subunit AddB [Bacillus alkalicola]
MTVSFLLGRTGAGKTTQILHDIIKKIESDPKGTPIIYLVPDQMTFQSEVNLVKKSNGGMTRVQVLSFSRLALRILQETGGVSRYHLQKTGIHMLLRKIVEQNKGTFNVFGRSANANGFIDQLEQMVTELKRYNISQDNLNERYDDLVKKDNKRPQEVVLQEKLHDIKVVYEAFEQELSKHYLGSEDYLALLAEQIPKSSYLREAEIYVDGFHSFTPLENLVLVELMKHCPKITFALTMEKYDLDAPIHELDLFFETAKTFQELNDLCEDNNISVTEPILFSKQHRFNSPAIAHIERNYDTRPPENSEEVDGVHIISAVHRRSEVEGVAREILHLVRDKNYRFQNIAILLRNMGDYVDLLETIFEDYSIPLFLDEKRSMLNHPVIEFIRSSLEIIHGHWRYEAVFRCFKTDLLFPIDREIKQMRERVDQMENYVLSYGIQGYRWYQKEPWTYRRVRTSADGEKKRTETEEKFERELNELRGQLTEPLIQFERKMKRAKSVREQCETLYLFLEECEVPKKLENMRKSSEEMGELRLSREHDQVWSAVIDLLDQMVEMAGNEKVSFDMFRTMLDSGLESIKFAIIPPALDQVIVADMERSRLSDIQCAFIMGVNEGVIPAKPDDGSIISEEERDLLQQGGTSLAPGSTRQLLNENFIIYMAKSTPSDRLYLTYPLADDEGKSLQPSIVIKRMKDFFPNLKERLSLQEPTEVPVGEQLQFVSTPWKSLSMLTYQLQAWKKGYPIGEFWWDVYNWYADSIVYKNQAKMVLKSLFYNNKPKQLTSDMTEKLYGNHIQTSVSRMEQYQSCPFAQFANYGLQLKERETYKLEAPDVGTLFHAALKEMAEHLRKNGRDFSNLTKEECKTLSKEVVNNLAPKIQREILLSSNKYNYIKQKLEEVVARASSVLSAQSKVSGFSPVGLEVGFGPGKELPPLTFQLENGSTMELVGRIDRVDQSTNGGLLLRIIDYKSSKKDVQLMDVYYGLALQMLIYLDVVITFSENWLGTKASPAGVLYFHVHNPLLQAKETLTLEQIEQELFKQFKMKGLIAADPEVARLMDENIDGGRSNIIPAGLKKNGEFYSGSSIISNSDYEALRQYLRKKIVEIGSSITSGSVDIKPVKNKQHTACTFCSFKPVCQFDPTEINEYRTVPKLKDEEILTIIREEGGSKVEDK